MSLGLSDTTLVAPDNRVGRVIAGRYRLSSVLGSGAVGVVYAATDVTDGTPLAIKVLAEHDDVGGQAFRRFQREGAALQKLSHPHVVRVFDAGTDAGEAAVAEGGQDDRPAAAPVAYIAMERLEGETLAERIDFGGALPRPLFARIATQVLEALAYAHQHQVVHRDLKPSNIFLSGDRKAPTVKLLDFGLAKFLAVEPSDVSQTLTRTGMVLGTPLYMAPEQGTGDRVDERADVYAAGCLLYEMLTGEPPFLAESQADVVRAHLVTPVPPLPGDAADGTRTALSALIARAMAKRPEERYADGGELLSALRRVLASSERSPVARVRASVAPVAPKLGALLGGGTLRTGMLLLGAVLAAFALGKLIGDDPPTDPAAPAGEPAVASADLWAERGVPEELRHVHADVVEGGQGIGNAEIALLRRFARDNRGDARPYLLLARGFLNQHWRKDAIVRYRRAVEVDPSVLAHAAMLTDLIDIAEGDKYAELAVDTIAELYGAAALPAAREAMNGRPKDSDEHTRLAVLVERLQALPDAAR